MDDAKSILALMQKARRMRYVYTVLGATIIGSAFTASLFIVNIGTGKFVVASIIFLIFTLLLGYHAGRAANVVKREYGPYVYEHSLIEKTEMLARQMQEKDAKDESTDSL